MSTAQSVADEADGNGGSLTDKAAEHFGFIIAFLLPGLAGLWAAAYYSPNVKKWMTEAATHETSLGGFLFLMVAAIGAGVAVQVLRWGLFEQVLPRVCTEKFCATWLLERPTYDEGRVRPPAIQAALDRIRDQHYRYYQSHGGLFIALAAVYLAWVCCGPAGTRGWAVGVGLVLLEVALFFGALDAQKRGRIKRVALLGPKAEE